MRAPLSWIREYADLPADVGGRALAERLTGLGLEVETVDVIGGGIDGPVVIGRVLSYEDETHSNGKTVRWCTVDVGAGDARGIVCGAQNFPVHATVVVALPGATLPGGFAITARKTYGHVSDGMICSARELGLGDEHEGILVLPDDHEPGEDAVGALGLGDEVLDIAVTPDRSYALSLRGIAREAATAYDVAFRDPADVAPARDGAGYPGRILDPGTADRLVLASVRGIDGSASSPAWMQRRLLMCGMRTISLAVDVTNYVMLELGQPLHAYDRNRLTGDIVVRRAGAGESVETLDHVRRELHPEDVVIADDSGPIGLAGTMGGAATEVDVSSHDLVIEAAHFDPVSVARTARRHKLPSEASRRFERGVDPDLPRAAAVRAVGLLEQFGGGEPDGLSVTEVAHPAQVIELDPHRPARTGGFDIPVDRVVRHLETVGCTVVRTEDGRPLEVRPPSWRPDLQQPADLDEEVIRLEGYDAIPSLLPSAPAGRGLTNEQRLRRRVGQVLAHAGYVEAPCQPFVGTAAWDALGIGPGDPRRRTLRLANPLSDEEPELRTTLLPGLLGALRRNESRGLRDVGLFEMGLVFLPAESSAVPPRPAVNARPSLEEQGALDAALPRQPWHVGVVVAGHRELAGWWGPSRAACWADAIEAARTICRSVGVEVVTRQAREVPWHPGRCAQLEVAGRVIGYAGELHPRSVSALGLPHRAAAMEIDLTAVMAEAPDAVPAPRVSPYPVATQDVALVVEVGVPAEEVGTALRDGAGELLESLRLFDVYEGDQVGAGNKSLAYTLRFRAPDRTLTADEVSGLRQRAVEAAAGRTGAVLRGG